MIVMEISVYVDGSFSTNDPSKTYGGSILLVDEKPILAIRHIVSQVDMVRMRNIGGELIATTGGIQSAMSLIEAAHLTMVDCITIYYDYVGIREFVKEVAPWKPTTRGAMQYVAAVNMIKTKYPNIKIKFVKVKAHSGNKWNEIADSVAKGDVPALVRDVLQSVEV